jgi:hypothetical protein
MPLPKARIIAVDLEEFRFQQYATAPADYDNHRPALDSITCAWRGSWSPLQRPVFAHTAQQVAPSLQEQHIDQVLPDPEINDDGAINEVITDESDDEESLLANLPVTRGAFINSYSEANRVISTFSSMPDLGAAVAVSWTSCEAVQPLLSKAVMAKVDMSIALL